MGTKTRWSPRLGARSSNTQPGYVQASARTGLKDITNLVESHALHVDKAKPLKQNLVQPLVPTTVPEPLPAGTAVEGKCASGARTDEAETTDAQSVLEYVPDIWRKLFDKESALLPQSNYMDSQTDLTDKMRTILIDWLVEVHMKYRLSPQTLHLTVNIIDRYLARKPVTRKRLQLVGVVAMFIASKFEEIQPPELHEWVYITDNAYKKEDVLVMECNMLTTLSFLIVVPTAAHFFEPLQKANGCDVVHRELAQYLLELSLLDLSILKYTPSHTAAAALLLSNELLKRQTLWPEAMVQQSCNTEEALQSCVKVLRQLLEADRAGVGGQLQAVHKKFSVASRQAVAKMKF